MDKQHYNELLREVEFLRHFYEEASYSMGPADMDIYDAIKRDFLESEGYLPEGYQFEEEEE